MGKHKKDLRLPGGESNPGLPLYYQGCRTLYGVYTILLISGFIKIWYVFSPFCYQDLPDEKECPL